MCRRLQHFLESRSAAAFKRFGLAFLCRIGHQPRPMKRVLLLFIMSAACACGVLASDSLPFPVSVGGQAAKDGTPFAKIENPVASDAELSVGSKDAMIIVNVHAVNAKNEPVPGATPAVILLQGKTKTNLDKTMDGKKLAAGTYVLSVVSEGKTASILLTIK